MTLLRLIKSNPAVIPAFSVLGSDFFFSRGKRGNDAAFTALLPVRSDTSFERWRREETLPAFSRAFEMQMSDKLNEL